MGWYINQAGSEVFIDPQTLARIQKRGDMHLFRKRPTEYDGSGPKNKVAIVYQSPNGANGIGDYIHAMPALCAKVEAGFEVHVWSSEFFRPIIERCGCIYHDYREAQIGWLKRALTEYGTVYMLTYWCIKHDEYSFGNVTMNRFDQMADYLSVKLPESFSWRAKLCES